MTKKRSTATYILPSTKIHKLEQIIAEYYKARSKSGMTSGKLSKITKGKVSIQAVSGSNSFLMDVKVLEPDTGLNTYRLTKLGINFGNCIMKHGDTSPFWKAAVENSKFISSVHELIAESSPINKDTLISEIVNRAGRDVEKKAGRDGATALLSIMDKADLILESKEDNEIKISDKQRLPSDFPFANQIFGVPDKKYTYDLFMLMPFEPGLKPVYDDSIKKVAKELELSIARADDFFSQNIVMHEIWSAIAQATILIADCTGKNPNVFYEIGLAHAINKPVILITQNENDVPFDLRHRRYIQYTYTPPGMKKFETDLYTTISETLKDLKSSIKPI
jgi:hypothetical protein